MFELSISQGYENGEVEVEENSQENVYIYMGITISNYQGLWLEFSLRSPPQNLWVMWVYIVWVQKVCIR